LPRLRRGPAAGDSKHLAHQAVEGKVITIGRALGIIASEAVTDNRLKNKAEVIVLRPGALGADSTPLAIAADQLRWSPVFSFEHDGKRLVAITSKGGANRVYLRQTHEFRSQAPDGAVGDSAGGRWRVHIRGARVGHGRDAARGADASGLLVWLDRSASLVGANPVE
jgi:hypothetical protein